jgi:hypothetical protein
VTASMRMASSSGVHFEFSFNRLSPSGEDIDGGLVQWGGGRWRSLIRRLSLGSH